MIVTDLKPYLIMSSLFLDTARLRRLLKISLVFRDYLKNCRLTHGFPLAFVGFANTVG